VRRFSEDEGFLLASALSFGLLLCVAPFTLILFSAAGFLLESDEIATWVFDSASLLVPAYGREIGEFLVLVTKERAVTGVVGAASLAIFASHVFSLTRTVLNRAFRVTEPRGLIHAIAIDVVAVLLVGGVVVAIAVAGIALVAVRSLAHTILPLPPITLLHQGLSLVGIYLLGMVVLFLVYRTFPSTRPSGKAAAVAAVIVTGLWEVARFAFSVYVHQSGVYGRLYGSFGIGIAALVWIYYSSALFVLGAELAAVLTARDRAVRRRLLE
jgi:membrane protein